MNLKALRIFRQIVLTGSLAEASRALNVSTPAASRLVSLLESEIGIVLFERDKRQLRLSQAGDLFYRRIVHTLDGLEDIPRVARDIDEKSLRSLSIVTAAPMANSIVSPALAQLRQQEPGFQCSLNVETRFDIESRVAARGSSLGLVSLPIENAILELEIEPFLRARVGVLMPKGHPLAAHSELTMNDIKDSSFIGLRRGQRWRDRLEDLFLSEGHQVEVDFETSSTVVALQMVRDGLGLALIDQTAINPALEGDLVLCPLAPARWHTYAFLHPKGTRNKLSTAFIAAIKTQLAQRIKNDPQLLELI
ncbi:MAG: LysR family transcriptional regulator [Pseudooceanicola sp.]